MLILAGIAAALAAAVHCYIFWLEALAFEPQGRRVFGIGAEHAGTVAPWAYNQGFYNLFLAVVTGLGVALLGEDRHAAVALILAGTGSMLCAALVLVGSDRTKTRAGLVQGTFPALSLLALAAWGLA